MIRRSRCTAWGNPETTVLEVSREFGADLIVMGTELRPASTRLFLGPRAGKILFEAECPVAIINVP